ncbi:FkbM family methyltransferase [Paenibacillus hamazuiensis]|uniref:FkbM family methyltransferase n=1 Tax=Paenibacillus hamazuiensis TaxID=2936508 RepID=UPI00200D337E|nr:FkbM family methyltransferase [Paenibacillus hamazuiensis]
MIDLYSLCKNYGIGNHGVIHLGAHEGQEVHLYQSLGMQNILFVEANPDVYHRLNANVSSFPNVRTANYAITDRNGVVQFHVTTSDFCSSVLPLKTVTTNYPGIAEMYQITIPSRTVDSLLAELHFSPADFKLLNMDIQGAELLALQGAGGLLQHLDAITTEVNFEELYEGCVLIGQLDHFLSVYGFHRVETVQYHPTWGDAFYVRGSLIGR